MNSERENAVNINCCPARDNANLVALTHTHPVTFFVSNNNLNISNVGSCVEDNRMDLGQR